MKLSVLLKQLLAFVFVQQINVFLVHVPEHYRQSVGISRNAKLVLCEINMRNVGILWNCQIKTNIFWKTFNDNKAIIA